MVITVQGAREIMGYLKVIQLSPVYFKPPTCFGQSQKPVSVALLDLTLPTGRDRGRCCIAHQEGRRWVRDKSERQFQICIGEYRYSHHHQYHCDHDEIRGHVGQDEQDLCWGR